MPRKKEEKEKEMLLFDCKIIGFNYSSALLKN